MISRTKEVCPLVSTLLNILTNELGTGRERQSLFIERSYPLSGNLKRFFLIQQPPRKQKFDFQTVAVRRDRGTPVRKRRG